MTEMHKMQKIASVIIPDTKYQIIQNTNENYNSI